MDKFPAPVGEFVSLIVEQRYDVGQVVASQMPEPIEVEGQPASVLTPNAVTRVLLFNHGSMGAQGPQGPAGDPGADASIHARRFARVGDYAYLGSAPAGSVDAAPVWNVTRLYYDAGVYQSAAEASSVNWTDFLTHTYT